MLFSPNIEFSGEETSYTDIVYPPTHITVASHGAHLVKFDPLDFFLKTSTAGTVEEQRLSRLPISSAENDLQTRRTGEITKILRILTTHVDNHPPLEPSPLLGHQPGGLSVDLTGLISPALTPDISLSDIPPLSLSPSNMAETDGKSRIPMAVPEEVLESSGPSPLSISHLLNPVSSSSLNSPLRPVQTFPKVDLDCEVDTEEVFTLPGPVLLASTIASMRPASSMGLPVPFVTTRALRLPRMRRGSKPANSSRGFHPQQQDATHSQQSRVRDAGNRNGERDVTRGRDIDGHEQRRYYSGHGSTLDHDPILRTVWEVEKAKLRQRRMTGYGMYRPAAKRVRLSTDDPDAPAVAVDHLALNLIAEPAMPAQHAPAEERPTCLSAAPSSDKENAHQVPDDLFAATEALELASRKAIQERQRLRKKRRAERSLARDSSASAGTVQPESSPRSQHRNQGEAQEASPASVQAPDDLFAATDALEREFRGRRQAEDSQSRPHKPYAHSPTSEVSQATSQGKEAARPRAVSGDQVDPDADPERTRS